MTNSRYGTKANIGYQLHRVACALEEIRDEIREAKERSYKG